MGLTIQGDGQTPSTVYNWRVYLLSTGAAFGAFLFGYCASFIGTMLALPSWTSQFGSDSTLAANVVTSFQCAAFGGSFLAFPLAENFGRVRTIQVATCIFLVGAVVMMPTTVSTGLGPFYVGRCLTGLGVGSITNIVPIYIAEISPPGIRGRLVGFYELSYQLSSLLGFWVNLGVENHVSDTSYEQWRIPVGLQLIPASLLLIATFFMLETPRWLQKMGRSEQATRNLVWIRHLEADHPYVMNELTTTQQHIDMEQAAVRQGGLKGLIKEMCVKGNRNRVALGCCVMMCQNLSGINAINYYSPTIFKSIGVTGSSASILSTGIFGVVKLVASVIALVFLVDSYGRKPLLLIGSAGSAFCMFFVACFIAIYNPQPGGSQTSIGRGAIAMIYLFGFFYCASWNGVSWLICSEIYPLRIRSLAITLTTTSQWAWQVAISRATPSMIANIGSGTYFFFGACLIAMGFWVWFCVPETKGKTLEKMDELFGLEEQHRGGGQRDSVSSLEKGEVRPESDSPTAAGSMNGEGDIQVENKQDDKSMPHIS